MSFFEYVDNLRDKPRAYRLRIVFVVSGAVTVLIALVWFSASGAKSPEKNEISASKSNPEISPLDQLRSSVAGIADFMGIDGFDRK